MIKNIRKQPTKPCPPPPRTPKPRKNNHVTNEHWSCPIKLGHLLPLDFTHEETFLANTF